MLYAIVGQDVPDSLAARLAGKQVTYRPPLTP